MFSFIQGQVVDWFGAFRMATLRQFQMTGASLGVRRRNRSGWLASTSGKVLTGLPKGVCGTAWAIPFDLLDSPA